MQELYKSGRYFFAVTVIAFGIIQFISGNFMAGFLPVDEHLPGRRFFLYLVSIVFLAGGLAMLPVKTARRAYLLTGFIFLLLLIYPHLIQLLNDLHNPGPWTSTAETLAFCGGAFCIASGFIYSSSAKNSGPLFPKLLKTGSIFIAVSLVIFAVQHFMYADFIATLIPSWIPLKLFWAYFVGAAFTATAISILINLKARLACTLLGFMYLFWFIFLHAPRVMTDTHKEPEWTSMFIALGFSGIFFSLASHNSIKDND
ncbi:MAG TPA: hypothetical protein VIL90_11615 [Puia sp.]|jgi:uncharacterized membrane protein